MTVFMIQFETLPVLLILSNTSSSSSSCRIWIIQAPALVDLRRHSFIMIKFSRTVPHALTYKQLTKLLQVHSMFCCHFWCVRIEPHCRQESTECLTLRIPRGRTCRSNPPKVLPEYFWIGISYKTKFWLIQVNTNSDRET